MNDDKDVCIPITDVDHCLQYSPLKEDECGLCKLGYVYFENGKNSDICHPPFSIKKMNCDLLNIDLENDEENQYKNY